MKRNGLVLNSPGGIEVPETFATTYNGACVNAFDYLYARKAWARPYWRDWEGFIRERRRRKWLLIDVYFEYGWECKEEPRRP